MCNPNGIWKAAEFVQETGLDTEVPTILVSCDRKMCT